MTIANPIGNAVVSIARAKSKLLIVALHVSKLKWESKLT